MGQLYRSQGQFKDQITDKQQAHANAGNQRPSRAKHNAQSVSNLNTPSFLYTNTKFNCNAIGEIAL
ncbi:hypothetical protein [Acinetobacter sp. SH20PTE14]|uniref:hypothetical protein n=1 Tax=Acinetobacter sp. SH20PTE14 TaxID=2905879 RepID=UPI001F270E36|nr:hypothetical protein [Acinetobacter sp. SH20PTE14]UIJ77228.1 hypothetical protein LXF01_08350 [Acinetobacter sp. SH20PTE14]